MRLLMQTDSFRRCITEPPIQLICLKKPFHLETKPVTMFAYEFE